VDRLIIHSYAKLNLYLAVLNKRKDNYHNLNTIFERIDLCDRIILALRPGGHKIRIICQDPDVPADETNLCYRSAKLLFDKFHLEKGLDITIIKRIPVSAGLGGGSSNAASVLLGLNRLLRLNLSKKTLAGLAKQIGSDVPFFVYGLPFAQGRGRGDNIKAFKEMQNLRLWHILVVPKIKVSTPLIYQRWDSQKEKKVQLTKIITNDKITNLASREKILPLQIGVLFNSLEAITEKLYPEVRRVKEKLRHLGLKLILMSGSGPAVFGIVSSRKEAVSLKRQLKEERSWQIFVARTL
jgi:4-diphosphocytidyl-2-C-methyl-D-erythritol kinase